MLAAKGHESLVRNTQLVAQRAEVLLDEIAVEAIVTGGYWGVGGEDHFPRYVIGSSVEVQTFFLHAIADRFQHGEATVPLVEMEDAGGNAHGFECTKAADAEEQLLTNAGAPVAAIEAGSKFQIFGRVALHIRIQQQKGATAHLDSPNLGADQAAAGLDFYDDGFALFADGELHGELIDVGVEVLFLLPALLVEVLAEVALAVEEADADEGNAEVGGALDVVSGEHTETAGINGQGLVQAELSRKVSHGAGPEDACVHRTPGAVCL